MDCEPSSNVPSVVLRPLYDGQPFAPMPDPPDISDEVLFTRADSVSASASGTATGLYADSFHISVIDVTDVTEPNNLYTGIVASGCADGLTAVDAEEDNRVLVYSPPMPPVITYDLDFPTRPDITLLDVDLPNNDTDTSPLQTGGELYDLLEEQSALLVDDILANLSTDGIEAFNNKLFDSPLGFCLSSSGIRFASQNANVKNTRVKSSLERKLLIVNRMANNSTLPAFAQDLSMEDKRRHDINQQARLDNARLNVSLNIKNIAMDVLVYNNEVANAQLIYREFMSLTEIEVDKLNLYGKQLSATANAMQGTEELIATYEKQLSVVEQVFTTFEQEMSLSEAVLNLLSKQIEVETLNINTDIKLVEGEVDKADSVTYQSKSATMAYGLDADGILAKASADLMSERANLQNTLLLLDVDSKNALIDSDNDLVAVIAESAGMKARSISSLFNLENTKSLNAITNNYDASHSRAVVQTEKQNKSVDISQHQFDAKMCTVDDQGIVNDGARSGDLSKLHGVKQYNYWVGRAAILLQSAKTTQKLYQKISS